MFNFSEKQGRLEVKVIVYLSQDLDNKELEKVFNDTEIEIDHPLISDYEVIPINAK